MIMALLKSVVFAKIGADNHEKMDRETFCENPIRLAIYFFVVAWIVVVIAWWWVVVGWTIPHALMSSLICGWECLESACKRGF